jgi:phenylpropionate dioxygenase-like ring-hydroxylating dioxygenase large terminal subunit
MFSNITPKHYFDKDIFELEKDSIFHNNWMFICFKDDVANPNDFVAKTIGKIPVVVQNMAGNVKAFMNVCSHRFSIIQTKESGNRGLFCPYHGWGFNKDGYPSGIPKKPLFKEFNEEDKCKLKLTEYTLELCGDLYFIHINKPHISLKEYLGEFYTDIESISNNKCNLIDVNNINIKSNWKIIVENTLESYHVNLVHGDTFKRLGASGLKFEFTNNHSNWDANLALDEDDIKLQKIHKNFSERPIKIKGYKHYLIYPNLLVSTSYGISFNFSIINPISPDETKFSSYVFLSEPKKSNVVVDTYQKSLIEFNRQVFDEDQVICEEVQKGVVVTNKPGVLSLEEERVHHFQEQYIKQINANS